MDPEVVCEPIAVRRSTAAKMLDCSATTIFKLQKAGELEVAKLGADDRITVESLRRYIQRRTKTHE